MKRLLIIGICLLLLVPCSVNADEIKQINGDFSIRNGIQFGMTSEEILQSEGFNGTIREKEGEVQIGYYINSIAGIPIGRAASNTLTYHCEKYILGNQLTGVDYWFGYYDNSSKAKDYFQQLYNGMVAKYGNSFNEFAPFYTDNFYVNVIQSIQLSSITTLEGFAQWILQYDNYYVVISAAHTDWKGSSQIHMSYEKVDMSSMESYLKDLKHDVNINTNDL